MSLIIEHVFKTKPQKIWVAEQFIHISITPILVLVSGSACIVAATRNLLKSDWFIKLGHGPYDLQIPLVAAD